MSITTIAIFVLLIIVSLYFFFQSFRQFCKNKTLVVLFKLILSVFVLWTLSQMPVIKADSYEISQIPFEKVEAIGKGWICSYVAELPDAHLAQVRVNGANYHCTVPANARAGKWVIVYKLSFSDGSNPLYGATYPPTIAKALK